MNSNFEKISLETLALVALETEVNIGKLKGFKVHRLNNNDIRCLEIPRNLIRSIKNEKNINNSGIYFLINDDNNSLYVGQATDILNRLTDHNREEKDFTKAIIFISDTNLLSKTFIDYLEWHYISELKNGKSWKMMNKDERNKKPNVTNFEEIKLLNLISDIDILLFCAGITLTETKNINKSNEVFSCNKAKSIFENGKITILSDSVLPLITGKKEKMDVNTNYYNENYKTLQSMENELIDWEKNSIIKRDNLEYKVLIDIKSLSPSRASNFAKGYYTSSGWEDWKNQKGETLDKVYRK